VRKGVDEIAIGVLLQMLQRHGTSRGTADQALQLIAPMGGNLSVGVQGEPVDAGTEGDVQERALALGAKAATHSTTMSQWRSSVWKNGSGTLVLIVDILSQ
jgi:hypothetical protein